MSYSKVPTTAVDLEAELPSELYQAPKQNKCSLWNCIVVLWGVATLALLILNLVGLILIAQPALEAKSEFDPAIRLLARITKEMRLDEFFDDGLFPEDSGHHTGHKGPSIKDAKVLNRITHTLTSSLLSQVLPNDVFNISNNLLDYNFTEGAALISRYAEKIGGEIMGVAESYDDGTMFDVGKAFLFISAISSKVEHQIKPLSGKTTFPDSNSTLADFIYSIPSTVVDSVKGTEWVNSAKRVSTIATKMLNVDWSGEIQWGGMIQRYNFNSQILPVVSRIQSIAAAIGSTVQQAPLLDVQEAPVLDDSQLLDEHPAPLHPVHAMPAAAVN
eukprot:CAMPEP_0174249696 /NCGR_PEP_ID=MMETSP0439-20130205/16_1 /TAXON_ID=0 /ORGANISM="Stereomyxa ramosa, Strain Chinc5" /LENGTH=329 /DNA_ID=CAMNT_0015329575 /DNA_START=34 /DNA_END=1023 /DNA_ORIENTATION=-